MTRASALLRPSAAALRELRLAVVLRAVAADIGTVSTGCARAILAVPLAAGLVSAALMGIAARSVRLLPAGTRCAVRLMLIRWVTLPIGRRALAVRALRATLVDRVLPVPARGSRRRLNRGFHLGGRQRDIRRSGSRASAG